MKRNIKNTYIWLTLIVCITVFLSSCKEDFLDVNTTDRISDDAITSDSSLFEDYVINRYMGVKLQDKEAEGTNPGFGRGFEYALWGSITDEAIYNSDDNTWAIHRGLLSPEATGIAGTIWSRSYRSIRECNYALQIIENVPMSASRKKMLIAELKFIRAFRYHDLIRNYGTVVLMGDKVYYLSDNLTDESLFKRSTITEGITYAVSQLEEAAADLPAGNTSAWPLGRATKGAALALKSRLLLYAASPLYGASSWETAAKAAKDVMDLGSYSLHNNYQSLFLTPSSNEIIFERLYAIGARHVCLEISNGANGYGGWAGNTPLQNLVDSYEVVEDENTAVPFDWNNSAHASAPYTDRDPRFYATIMYNGATYRDRKVETFTPGGKDSKDGKDNWNTSKTGYYLRKFIDEKLPIDNPWDVAGTQPWIYIRYAEILLNYAEAQNEAVGPDASVYSAINLIRNRAGMPELPTGLSQTAMRTAIQRERQVELAFEEHRFYDVRRWKIAMDTENQPAYGITITKNADGTFAYTRKVALDGRKFEEKHYWLPIPLAEIQASNGKLQQSPNY
ncbi:RagB/SusD family nutrient uptake outer membrane protein [Cytophagaceae bacterium DM2B3-1]|uniref:RagB/SusD family nutrient uptake outer membrane protein n=1 Tax=Xanthocytophaga flava TaxID=3048013 RepID=A0ABT7CH23_9BACT|nr:RagB/SusD family nutrient uptake outer membrane protein [Xanthocytophaga flavus]MDJ1493034.1 RagB/SusD family nutrient uptake outer membrane protein [Xanthocytophaga flavus]